MPPSICEVKKRRQRKHRTLPAAAMARAVARAAEVPKAINYLVDEGVTVTDIARELGVSREQVSAWRSERFEPRAPMVCFCLLEWAGYLRDMKAAAPLFKAVNDAMKAKEKADAQ